MAHRSEPLMPQGGPLLNQPPPHRRPSGATASYFQTRRFAGFSVVFSPFEPDKLAVAAAQHYGIVGNGRQFVLQIPPPSKQDRGRPPPLRQIFCFPTNEGLFDCCWSELNEHHLVSASGDGSVKLWDLAKAANSGSVLPLRSWEEHGREVYGVHWNPVEKSSFLSSSWDLTIKLWSPNHPRSISTFQGEHTGCIYGVVWSPRQAGMFASAGGDGSLKVWDVRQPSSVQTMPHPNELLCCDWNKYLEFVVAAGSVDASITTWDLRNIRRPISRLKGHEYAVRKLKYSPWSESALMSASYDMSVVFWDELEIDDPLVQRCTQHTEFVMGVDWNLFVEGQVASVSWDELVCVWLQGDDPAAAK